MKMASMAVLLLKIVMVIFNSWRPGLKMTSVYGVQSWDEVGVGVVLCLGGPEVVLGLGPLAPVRLLHAQASAATIT